MDTVLSWLGVTGKDQDSSDEEVIGNYVLGKVLGQGTFGVVRQAAHKTTGQRVAIKIIAGVKADREVLERETKIQARLQHQNIVRIFEVIEKDDTTFIVMELVHSELFDYLLEHGRLKEEAAKKLFMQIVAAVEHCHDQMVVHRDLKPENILLDKNKNVKLADFGLSAEWRKGALLTDSCGSPNYAAPELLYKNCEYEGPEIDVWSCGVILYVLLTNTLPFDQDNIPNLFKVIKRGQYKMPGYISADAKDLIRGMIEVDRSKRLTMTQVRNHPWLASENAQAVAVTAAVNTAQRTSRAPTRLPGAVTACSTTVIPQGLAAQPVIRVKSIGLKGLPQSAQHIVRVVSAVGFIAQS